MFSQLLSEMSNSLDLTLSRIVTSGDQNNAMKVYGNQEATTTPTNSSRCNQQHHHHAKTILLVQQHYEDRQYIMFSYTTTASSFNRSNKNQHQWRLAMHDKFSTQLRMVCIMFFFNILFHVCRMLMYEKFTE